MDIHGNESSAGTSQEPSNRRTIGDILKDIGSVLQQLIRSEVKLAKDEVLEAAREAKASAILYAIGGVLGIFGIGFLLLAVLFGLTLVLPAWLSALIVGVALLICAAIGIAQARRSLKSIHAPRKTIQTVKEDFQWMTEQLKP